MSRKPSMEAIAERRAADDAKLRAMLDKIATKRAELDAEEATIRALLGESKPAQQRGNGHDKPETWQCFDCDGKIPAIGPKPEECPLCSVSPFEVRA